MIGTFIKTSPTSYLIGFAILLASHGYVYFTGREHGLERYYQLKADVHAAQVAIERDNQQKRAEAERAVLDVSLSWKRALDHSRRNPPVRVLPTNCHSGASAQATGVGLKPDAATTEPRLSATRDVAVEECEARLNNAVIDAAQVIHLQYDRNNLCQIYGCE